VVYAPAELVARDPRGVDTYQRLAGSVPRHVDLVDGEPVLMEPHRPHLRIFRHPPL
jgi:hypothetical protein